MGSLYRLYRRIGIAQKSEFVTFLFFYHLRSWIRQKITKEMFYGNGY